LEFNKGNENLYPRIKEIIKKAVKNGENRRY
jgi:hypothetical protein